MNTRKLLNGLIVIALTSYANARVPQPMPATELAVCTFVEPQSGATFDRDGNRLRRAEVAAAQDEPPIIADRGLPAWTPFGPSGADAESIAASPLTSDLVIAGVSSSVGGGALYRSINRGVSWTAATGTGNRPVVDVDFASNGTAWAATHDGLFRSIDGGVTWTSVTLPIAGQAVVEDVSVDPANSSIIWVGIGQLLGGTSPIVVLKSTNGGTNWSDMSPPVTPGMGATVVALDPANPQRVVAGFTPNFGGAAELWLSTDGGASWAERSTGLPGVPYNDAAFSGGSVFVAGGQDFGAQFLGLYRTDDDGLNWIEISAGWPSRAANAVSIDPSNAQRIVVGTTRAGVARSTDGGDTWTFGTGGTGTYQVNDVEFAPLAPTSVYLGLGSLAVLRSDDSAASFAPASNGMSRLEITSFAYNPNNPAEIAASYVGVNDGGIFLSIDGGATWALSQAPLPRWTKVYFDSQGTLYGVHNGPLGRAEDGLWRRNANGSWDNLGPGVSGTLDNIGLNIAATPGPNPIILVGGYRWLVQPRVAQVWSYNRVAPGAWELEYAGSINNEQVFSVLWVGGSSTAALAGVVNFGSGSGAVLRSSDGGNTFNAGTSGYPGAWHAWELAQGASPQTIFVAATPNTSQTPGAVIRSDDGGQTWTQQSSVPVYRYLAADPDFADTLWALSPFNNARPQVSTNGGNTFVPYDTGFIPLAGGRDLVFGGVVNGQRRLYVATGAGGYATDLPPAPVECDGDVDGDLDVDLTDLAILLANFGTSDDVERGDGDLDGDDNIDLSDLARLLAEFGATCT